MSRGTPVARKQYILTAPGCYRGPPRQRPHISNGMEPFEFIVLDISELFFLLFFMESLSLDFVKFFEIVEVIF